MWALSNTLFFPNPILVFCVLALTQVYCDIHVICVILRVFLRFAHTAIGAPSLYGEISLRAWRNMFLSLCFFLMNRCVCNFLGVYFVSSCGIPVSQPMFSVTLLFFLFGILSQLPCGVSCGAIVIIFLSAGIISFFSVSFPFPSLCVSAHSDEQGLGGIF